MMPVYSALSPSSVRSNDQASLHPCKGKAELEPGAVGGARDRFKRRTGRQPIACINTCTPPTADRARGEAILLVTKYAW